MPIWLVIIAAILLMWMARHPVRQVLWQIFFITGRLFGRWGLWLKEHGHNARVATSDKIAAQRADELEERMVVLEDRIGHRAEKLSKELTPTIARLDKSTHAIATSATALTDINLEDAAERAFRAAMPSIEQGRNLSKLEKNIANNTAKSINERMMPLRPALSTLKTEAPKLKEVAGKLGEIDQRFNQEVDKVNKTFVDFEECLKSEDRVKVAGKHSIVIPWLIAVFITGVALSGVFLNFFLIERPMSEIVGEGSKIGGLSLPQFAALIVIFLEFVAGVVLMDAAGFTKLIPAFHGMSVAGRRIMLIAALAFLVAFSALEIMLAFVREGLIEQAQRTRDLAMGLSDNLGAASPAPGDVVAAAPKDSLQNMQLATWAQVVLAAVIPWLLATAALPLEVIIRNSVFMVQLAGAHLMLGLAFVFKTLNVALKNLGLFVLTVYDLVIFAPLWLERRIKGTVRNRKRAARGDNDDDPGGDDDDALVLDKPSAQKRGEPPRRERERDKGGDRGRERELMKA